MPTSGSGTGTPALGAGSTTLLAVIPEAAGHPFLGGARAFRTLTPTGTGTPTTIVSTRLTDSSGRQTYTDWWAYCYASAGGAPLTGESRLVQTVTLASGTFTVNRPYGRATEATDLFWLLRTFDRDRWCELANTALRQMKRRLTFTGQGVASALRYALPPEIERAEEVVEVGTRAWPLVATEGKPEPVRWFGVEDNDGALELVLGDPVAADKALVYYALKPYAAPGENLLVADTDATVAPADWLVAELVALALVERLANATSQEDRQGLQWALTGAGRLVSGFRRKYESQGERRVMAPDPRF